MEEKPKTWHCSFTFELDRNPFSSTASFNWGLYLFETIILLQKIVPVLGGIHPCPFLYISAEVGNR